MKKQIISLLVLVSLSCQLTYPMIEGVRKRAASISEYLKGKGAQIRELYTVYGKEAVDDAISSVKKYGPKQVIARDKEITRAYHEASKAYKACVAKHCANQKGTVCRDTYCSQELNASDAASKAFVQSRLTIVIAVTLGIAIVFGGALLLGKGIRGQKEPEYSEITEESQLSGGSGLPKPPVSYGARRKSNGWFR